MPRFPEAKYTAVGAFIFLRFFCPAIVAPEVEGLVATLPSKEMRRGLLLIAKVIQNLANNVLFGAKEPYMFPLNEFLAQHIYRVTTFLREISVRLHVLFPSETMLGAYKHRFPRKRSMRLLKVSRSISAHAWRFIGFSTITGTTYAKD